MAMVKRKTHSAVTVDLETHRQLKAMARYFTKRLKTPISQTDIVRMGITAILMMHPSASSAPKGGE